MNYKEPLLSGAMNYKEPLLSGAMNYKEPLLSGAMNYKENVTDKIDTITNSQFNKVYFILFFFIISSVIGLDKVLFPSKK